MLIATHVIPAIALGSTNDAFGFWFISLTVITVSAALGAMGRNIAVSLTLWTLAAGSALTAAGFIAGNLGLDRAGGCLFVISAGIAWYTATAMVMEGGFGRTILPLGSCKAEGNVPGRVASRPIQYAGGMPGARLGQ